MGSPKLEPVVLGGQERQVLQAWAWRRKTAQGLALRSRIVLASADGASVTAVAEDLRICGFRGTRCASGGSGFWRPGWRA